MKLPFALLVHLSILPSCLGKCYYPNGKEAVTDFPCDPDAENSMCCAGMANFASACLSNKLCLSSTGRTIRGSCTDQTWNSPECANYCMDKPTNGWDLTSCSNVTQKDTSFCCAGAQGCCDGGVGRFEVLPADADTWALWDAGKSRYVVVKPLSAAASSSSATSSATSTTQSGTRTASTASQQTSATDTSASPDRSQPPSTETAPSGQTATTQPSSAETSPSSSGLSTAAQAGIGVGAGVGALLVAAVAYLWWKLHKMQQAKGENAQWQGPHDPYPTQSLAPPYYPEEPRHKYELQGVRETHELQGHHYFVQGDTSSAELTTQPHYAVESPVATSGIAR